MDEPVAILAGLVADVLVLDAPKVVPLVPPVSLATPSRVPLLQAAVALAKAAIAAVRLAAPSCLSSPKSVRFDLPPRELVQKPPAVLPSVPLPPVDAPAVVKRESRLPWTKLPSIWYIPFFMIVALGSLPSAEAFPGTSSPVTSVRDILLQAGVDENLAAPSSVVGAWPSVLEEKTVVKLARSYRGDVPLWKI